jgi:hypothetical protein
MSSNLPTLYNLEDDLAALVNSEDLVETEEQHIQIVREIAQAGEKAVAKRDSCIRMFRYLDLQQQGIDTEIKRLQELKASYATSEKRLEKYVIRVMEDFCPIPKKGAKKLEGSIGVLSLRQNPPAVEISDEAAVPTKYKNITVEMDADTWLRFAPDPLVNLTRRTTYTLKKAEIKEVLKDGGEVPGADLGFGSKRLEIK